MKKVLFLILLGFISVNCKEKNHTVYYTYISFYNKTGYDLNVKVFPKAQFEKGDLYKMGTIGGGYLEKDFMLHKTDTDWYSKRDLFYCVDTTTKPTYLINYVFDSINIYMQNTDSTIIKFTGISSSHYSVNPFQIDSIWEKHKVLNEMLVPNTNGFTNFFVVSIDDSYIVGKQILPIR